MITPCVHRCRSLLTMTILIGLFSTGASWAAELAPAAATTPRAKLDRLLACQQADKDAALEEKRKTQAKIADIETFVRSLSDRPVHYAAHEKADRALAVSRDALAKVEERLRLADRKIGMTVRALSYLAPEQGGIPKSSSLADVPRQYKDWRADGENESRYLDGLFGETFGFVTDPELILRLNTLVNRLQTLSSKPNVPIQVRVLERESGIGAAATATTVYFDKAYLDGNPSESELLFIAGHELAHVQLGHFSETMLGLEEDRKRLANDHGLEGTAAFGWRAEQALLKMRTGPWEQRQEEAADLLGAQQALEAGASPKGIQEAMLRMEEDEKAWRKKVAPDIQRYQDSLRDHAKPLDRLEALESALGDKFWERTDLQFSSSCPR